MPSWLPAVRLHSPTLFVGNVSFRTTRRTASARWPTSLPAPAIAFSRSGYEHQETSLVDSPCLALRWRALVQIHPTLPWLVTTYRTHFMRKCPHQMAEFFKATLWAQKGEPACVIPSLLWFATDFAARAACRVVRSAETINHNIEFMHEPPTAVPKEFPAEVFACPNPILVRVCPSSFRSRPCRPL